MGLVDAIKNIFVSKKSEDGRIPADILYTKDVRRLTSSDYIRYFKSWVYIASTTIASDIATADFQTIQGKRVVEHDIEKLLTWRVLYLTGLNLEIYGSSFWLVTRVGQKVKKISTLHPNKIAVGYYSNGDAYYEYTRNDGSRIRYTKDDVISFFVPGADVESVFITKGQSVMDSIGVTVQLEENANEFNMLHYKYGAKPDGYLSSPHELTREQTEQYSQVFKNKYMGVGKSNNVPVLGGGMEYKAINMSQKDMDYIEQRRLSRDEILAAFKVPKAILGLADNGQNLNIGTYENIYARRTIAPLLMLIQETLNNTIFQGYTFQFIDVIPSDDTAIRYDYIAGIMTLNEARQSRNLPPVKNGDIFRDNGMVSASDLGKEPTEDIDEDQSKDFVLKTMEELKQNIKTVLSTKEDIHERNWEAFIKRNDGYEANLRNKFIAIFEQQREDVLHKYNEKSFSTKSLLSPSDYIAIYLTLVGPEMEKIMQVEGGLAIANVGISDAFSLSDDVRKWIRTNIRKFAKAIDTTTQEAIATVIEKIQEEGLPYAEGEKMILGVFDDLTKNRVNSIVRTESVRASQQATIYGWEQSGVVSGKEWYTAKDERVCPYCGDMHGKVVGLQENYFKKGDVMEVVNAEGGISTLNLSYGDTPSAPLHPRCRCTLLPVLKE